MELKSLGWKVLVVWECELRDEDRVKRRLERFLSEGKAARLKAGR